MTDTEKDIAAFDIGIHTITAQENKVFIYGEEVKNAEHFEEILAKEYSAMERNKAAIEECRKQICCLRDRILLDIIRGFSVDWLESKVDAYESILRILEGAK